MSRFARGAWSRLDTERGLPSAVVNVLHEDLEGSLWLGTAGGGLARLRDNKVATFGPPEGLPGELVYSLHEDRQGNLWIGMSDAGLVRLRDGKLRHFTSADGLRTASCNASAAVGTRLG